jgi:hypothetical protein
MPVSTQIKKLYNNPSVKSVGIYTFTNFFSKAVSFLLLFVFTNPLYISPSENGLLSLFSTSLLLLMPFLSMGIIHSVSADFYKLEKRRIQKLFQYKFCYTGIGIADLYCRLVFFQAGTVCAVWFSGIFSSG